MNINRFKALLGASMAMTITGSALAQGGRNVTIETTKITDHVYMLVGQGGNIGLCVGEDGVFMIDDQFAPLTGKILAAIAEITDQPVEFLLNTHYHGDHTGGNENMSGEGAIIVAHDNVRQRMSTEQFSSTFNSTTPPSPEGALPVITFAKSMTFHYNDDDLHIFHVSDAHTDGDAIVHFRNGNVFHMGDTFFNGMYPYIDADVGGTIDGVIAAADAVLKLANGDTKIIPGHGPLCGIDDLEAYRSMLKGVRANILKLIKQGKSKDEVIAAKPTEEFDEQWGKGFMKPDVFTGLVYMGLARAQE
ncbi:MAG: MBL fold metallo-hydrolase [Planctomycetota bacterium]|nr:MBL fold metallo-hydrolase [Planctomycetota bacterium]